MSKATIELRELITGRLVSSYTLPTKAGKALLEVQLGRVISGNYVYSLLVNQITVGTGKMVVIK